MRKHLACSTLARFHNGVGTNLIHRKASQGPPLLVLSAEETPWIDILSLGSTYAFFYFLRALPNLIQDATSI